MLSYSSTEEDGKKMKDCWLAIMSSDCFSDLICNEESSETFTDIDDSHDLDFPLVDIDTKEEEIVGLIQVEGDYMPGFDYHSKFLSQLPSDALARDQSVEWILKVHAFYNFQPLTPYLAVNYMDRFLASCSTLPQANGNGWPLQLLSVACLSLAAKLEETQVPNLSDLQVEGTKFIFEPQTIRRMELLVLDALDWRLRSVTPFTFIEFFGYKADLTGTYIGFLVSRATQIILATLGEIMFLNYLPSSLAAAAVLCAISEINLPLLDPGYAATWCHGLNNEKTMGCYQLMQDVGFGLKQRKRPKVLPLLRVMTRAEEFDYGDSSSTTSSSSLINKRRKLNNSIDKDKF